MNAGVSMLGRPSLRSTPAQSWMGLSLEKRISSAHEWNDNLPKADRMPLSLQNFAPRFGKLVADLRDSHSLRPRSGYPAGQKLEQLFLSLLPIEYTPAGHPPVERDAQGGARWLTTSQALNCIHDEVRTKKFLTAVYSAVTHVASLANGIPFYLVDAGCGPIPILGICAALSAPNVHVTCLELNPVSAQIARMIVDRLGLSTQIKVIEADATTFKPTEDIDILVSETMYSGLCHEPIVKIFENLSKYGHRATITIPQKIEVMGGVMDPDFDLRWLSRQESLRFSGIDIIIDPVIWGKDTTVWIPGTPLPTIRASINIKDATTFKGKRCFDLYERDPSFCRFPVVGCKVDLGYGQTLMPEDSEICHPHPIAFPGGKDLGACPHVINFSYVPGGPGEAHAE